MEKVIVKTYIVRKYFYFEYMLYFLNFLFIKEKSITGSQKILSSTTISTLIINQHILMISEGSCDTEDWVMASSSHEKIRLHFNNIYIENYF